MASHIINRVVVTGAASGLGKIIATEFLKTGSRVALVDLHAERLEATRAELSSQHADRVLSIRADITDDAAVQSIFKQTIHKFGQVDTLVNCAAIVDRFNGVAEHDVNLWRRVIDVNLTAPFLLSRLAVQEFLRDGRDRTGGAIVNISSIAGLHGAFAGAAYTSSKAGLIGLTKSTAAVYAKAGVRTNAICPGGMATDMAAGLVADPSPLGSVWPMLQERTKMVGGPVDMNKLSRLVVFLCGEDGKDVNGAIIPFDGGWVAM